MLTVGSPDVNRLPRELRSQVQAHGVRGLSGPARRLEHRGPHQGERRALPRDEHGLPGRRGSDFTGKLLLSTSLRVTDKLNGSPAVESATTEDFPLEVPIGCAATIATTTGGNCTLTTMMSALIPGAVKDGKRAMWAQGTVEAHDPGPNGTGYGAGCPGTCGDGDESVYLRQGVFIP